MLTLSLIILVLNHEDRLDELVRDIRATIPTLSLEVLVVYDVTQPELLVAVRPSKPISRSATASGR